MERRLTILIEGKKGRQTRHELQARQCGEGMTEEEQLEALHALIDKAFTSGEAIPAELKLCPPDSYFDELDRLAKYATRPRPEKRKRKTLSAMKRKILLYFKLGNSRKEVAGKIHRSPETVHSHLKELYKEYGVHKLNELLRVLEKMRVL